MSDTVIIKQLQEQIGNLTQRLRLLEEKMSFVEDFMVSSTEYKEANPYCFIPCKSFQISDFSNIPSQLLNVTGLKELPFDFAYVPSGIYFLCEQGLIQYIGQTINYGTRISAHVRDRRIKFDKVYFIPCHVDKLDEVERAFISHIQPPLNRKCLGMDKANAKQIVNQIMCKEYK